MTGPGFVIETLLFNPAVETAPERLKLAVHAGEHLAASSPEAISIAKK